MYPALGVEHSLPSYMYNLLQLNSLLCLNTPQAQKAQVPQRENLVSEVNENLSLISVEFSRYRILPSEYITHVTVWQERKSTTHLLGECNQIILTRLEVTFLRKNLLY